MKPRCDLKHHVNQAWLPNICKLSTRGRSITGSLSLACSTWQIPDHPQLHSETISKKKKSQIKETNPPKTKLPPYKKSSLTNTQLLYDQIFICVHTHTQTFSCIFTTTPNWTGKQITERNCFQNNYAERSQREQDGWCHLYKTPVTAIPSTGMMVVEERKDSQRDTGSSVLLHDSSTIIGRTVESEDLMPLSLSWQEWGATLHGVTRGRLDLLSLTSVDRWS